ncbi:MAG: hypothetical protein ACRD8O_00290 [Bryobacteraceae bacterium]
MLRSRSLQRLVLGSHRRAFRALLLHLPPIRRVVIVGGGLFPRTALILRELLPGAQMVVMDSNAQHVETARAWMRGVEFVNERFVAGELCPCDLLVIPLSFQGDREAAYRNPSAKAVMVHDWIWRPRGRSRVVSVLLVKRLNLIAT